MLQVTLYLPMVFLAPMAMLASARIGAVLNTVFAGFSATALQGRVKDCGSKIILTADSVMRGVDVVSRGVCKEYSYLRKMSIWEQVCATEKLCEQV